ncbi:integral membrane protein [Histoplasma capsulatum var. duboisii H88]|uniref:Integral membrane protein n=1 Tax=Ajellomyces capsulatus (strain H88) TaxID=544711 RepID=A0A8A1LTY7_AJEC8|nr:integral membrane protein [Histoplasma capsulatum var. duboisii H88]
MLQQISSEIPFFGGMLVLDLSVLDISNCTSLHRSYSQRCNCRRCTKTCNTASKTGGKLLHLVGGTYTTLFPPPPNLNGLDKSALLFHPYTWNNCLPRFTLLQYQHEQLSRKPSFREVY